jgi:hypothetical protein
VCERVERKIARLYYEEERVKEGMVQEGAKHHGQTGVFSEKQTYKQGNAISRTRTIFCLGLAKRHGCGWTHAIKYANSKGHDYSSFLTTVKHPSNHLLGRYIEWYSWRRRKVGQVPPSSIKQTQLNSNDDGNPFTILHLIFFVDSGITLTATRFSVALGCGGMIIGLEKVTSGQPVQTVIL